MSKTELPRSPLYFPFIGFIIVGFVISVLTSEIFIFLAILVAESIFNVMSAERRMHLFRLTMQEMKSLKRKLIATTFSLPVLVLLFIGIYQRTGILLSLAVVAILMTWVASSIAFEMLFSITFPRLNKEFGITASELYTILFTDKQKMLTEDHRKRREAEDSTRNWFVYKT